MKYYLDITILSDPEFKPSTLMNALFSKLHRILAQSKSACIGVSFPKHEQEKIGLGNLLRLHGAEVDLQQLMSQNWLSGMRDYTHAGEIKIIPSSVKHRIVKRVQAKSNVERLRRRLIKRKGITQEQAQVALPDTIAKTLSLPFVVLKSSSTGQIFRLFIEHTPVQDLPMFGGFSVYGLSQTATIPWF